ncbi:hypothetical protein EXQLCQDZ_CDS0016 [Staphylococcus phage PG-2021_5]
MWHHIVNWFNDIPEKRLNNNLDIQCTYLVQNVYTLKRIILYI